MTSNKNVITIILLIIYITLTISSNTKRKSFKELINLYLGKLDINNAYLSYDQYISLLNTLIKDFPNYLELSSIGKTYEGNEMPLIIMKSPLNFKKEKSITQNNTNTNINNNNETNLMDKSLYNKSGIFFNGMHHGREPVSMMMNIYLILHLLSLPSTYLHLFLSSTNIYFLPIINIDTYKYNCEKYLIKKFPLRRIMSRKNRRSNTTKGCQIDDIGIDLNRNYDFYFGADNVGSSGRKCQEDYRGEFPFSEPETNNIKKFVESHPNIKIVYNYHSWGNLIITPFNCLKKEESLQLMKKDFPIHFKMYEDFDKEAKFPPKYLFGNADVTIKYLANGDATDWFLGKKKILSFSLELGTSDKNSEVFYPDKSVTFEILEQNLHGGLYGIQKSMYYLSGELISANYISCQHKSKFSYNDIYFIRGRLYSNNNPKDNILKNCFSDELLLYIKVKITNKGFGDYSPGLEFPYFQQNNDTETTKKDEDINKKFFYFLSFDLKVDLKKVKSICFWSTLQTLYTIEVNNTDKIKNKTNINHKEKEAEETQYIGKIRCINVYKESDINDLKLFIDNEIKSMDFIILNLQIIVKKDVFLERIHKNKNRFLNFQNNNATNNNNEIIKIYTKKDRIIKSETINGEIIEWKFNNPTISIAINNFAENKNINYNNNKKTISYTILIAIICSAFLMIFIILRIIKKLRRRPSHDLLVDSRNNDMNMGINNQQIVNNLENANQNENINTEQILPVKIPRDDNEEKNNSNSNSDSPNELNP